MGYSKTNLFANCDFYDCLQGQYLCYRQNYCIDIELLCDDVHHCLLGDDEENCGKIKNTFEI